MLAFILITGFVLLVIAVILIVCLCMKKKQSEKLAKAKAFFATLQKHDDETDGEPLEQEETFKEVDVGGILDHCSE